jgi:RNA polymerase sigma factor (sigma-70 family)
MHRAERTESADQLFLQQLPLIERVIALVCARHHLAAADADDFASVVKLKFIDDNYAVLRKFEGRSSLKTYVTTVVQRALQDYRISAWGKWRPSAEAKRRGAVALLLDQYLTRDRFTFDEACELLWTKHQVAADRAALEQLAATLPARVRRRFEADDALVDRPAPSVAPDQAVELAEQQSTADRVIAVMKTLLGKLATLDCLLLTLHYRDGRTLADIATILRVDQKRLYRRRKGLLEQLADGFRREGIEAAAVLEILGHPAVHFDWDRDAAAESERPGPSLGNEAEEWL